MHVYVNGQKQSVSESLSLTKMIARVGIEAREGIAVAVNNEVITRDNWENHLIQDEDKITIITATQGG